MTSPKAYIFDVFGTLVDWRNSVAREAGHVFERKAIDVDPLAFADAWRGEYQPAMERIRSGNRGYVQLDDLHRENLDIVLKVFDIGAHLDDDERNELNTAWQKLDPWPDVVAGLTALRQKAIIAPCSNGSIALMTRLARYGGLPWDCVLGADIGQNYKPQSQVYLSTCAVLRLAPDEVMMVAAHNNDLEAAQAVGLQTCFIPRPIEYGDAQTEDLEATGDWDLGVDKIGDLAE